MNKLKKTITHFRRKLGMDSKLNGTINKFENDFDEKTKNIKENCDLGDFLGLLQIAEYGYLGKTKAIMLAYKLGYIHGEDDLRTKVLNHFYGSEVAKNER